MSVASHSHQPECPLEVRIEFINPFTSQNPTEQDFIMQRENTTQTEENLEIIETLEQFHHGEAQENRIRMLSLLAGNGMVIVGR